MSHRLTIPEFLAIRRALAAGMRHVDIARAFDLSIWTIAKIKDEQRFAVDPIGEDELPVDNAPADYEAQNLRRCPGCGAMVYIWPCPACKLATCTQRLPPAAEEYEEPEEEELRS